MSSSSSVPRIQVFRPTMEEFKDFSKYIEKIESTGAHKAGLAKIIPPEGWCPRKRGYDDIDLMIPAPISQIVTGSQGLYQQINVQQKAMNVREFRKLAESPKYRTPSHFDYEDLERKYWKNITYNSPIYGADVSGSLYDDGVNEFNIQSLNTILDLVKEDYEIQIEGVNTAYLYFGMWKTTFAWHTEDMDLYSINYLHFGAPKSWYVVPPEHGRRLERLAAGYFHTSRQLCGAFLRHKMTIISPQILKKYSIPCSKITQEPGEFMITFPFGYHSGFNHGFNCAESTNFALPRWIEYGKRSSQCTCRNDCVKICMDVFVRKFQPDRYELWKAGKDYGSHPEDPSRHYACPPPRKMEIAVSTKKEKCPQKTPKPMQKIKRHPVSKLEKLQNKKRKESVEESTDGEGAPCEIPKVKARKPRKKSVKKPPEAKVTMHEEKTDCVKEDVQMQSESEENLQMQSESEENLQTQSENGENLPTQSENEENNLQMQSENGENNQMQSENGENDHQMRSENKENPPPELKPFWDPGEKVKNEEDEDSQADTIIDEEIGIKSESENAKPCYHPSEAEIIDRFPLLKNAVGLGSLSVKFLDEAEGEKEEIRPETPQPAISAKYSDGSASFYNFELSKSIFAQNWRCEQVNNGLKIKLVSPKGNQSGILHTAPEFPKITTVGECSVSYTTEEICSDLNASIGVTQAVSISKDHNSSPEDNTSKVKRATNLTDSWAHPLFGLWQHDKYSFETECLFNQRLASIPPHCAVCVLFTPMLGPDCFPKTISAVPSCSPIKMPAFCYGDLMIDECVNSLVASDGSGPLLTCCICKVCVHASCYGVSELPSDSWICNRCSVKVVDVQCCLCVLRGGALKATTDGRWAHIVCAIFISEILFEDQIKKEPIDVSKISLNRQRLKCKYCFKVHALKKQRGCCIQCQSGKCSLPFHVTCGYMAGVVFETSDFPDPINIICTKHTAAKRKPTVRNLTKVSAGESVIAKHKNKRYYWARVKEKHVMDHYSILFEDNSHSTNTLPEDIVSKNVALHGPPEINEKVKVKWTDGKVYNGIYKGTQTVEMFVLEFDDGTVLQQQRKDIFAADEDLPKEVQSKMSHSSEGRNLNIGVLDTSTKRMRPSFQKYYAV